MQPNDKSGIRNPVYAAKIAWLCVIISFAGIFVPYPMLALIAKAIALIGIVLGVFGAFFGIRQRAGWLIICLNILAILLGFVSRVLIVVLPLYLS